MLWPRLRLPLRLCAGCHAAAAILLTAGCEPEPSLLCDRARVVWPFREIDPSADMSPQDGVQVDVPLRASLLPGTVGRLQVTPDGGEAVNHPGQAIADQRGDMEFRSVSLPFGRVTLTLNVQNQCGEASTERTVFVWDGLGYPACDLTLTPDPTAVGDGPQAIRAADDPSPGTSVVEIHAVVDAGRPDVRVRFFVLDELTGQEDVREEEAGDDLAAEFDHTFGQGEDAVRAVCTWEAEDLLLSSVTRRFLVDTRPPGCTLLEPAARVQAADDIDPAQAGIQFDLLGRSGAADVLGEPAEFEVNGVVYPAGAIDGGYASAVATIPGGPGAQVVTFTVRDRAGNPCTDTASF